MRMGDNGPATALIAMSQAEYEHFVVASTEEYAHTLARNLNLPLEEAREKARSQVGGILKDGFATAGHHFWHITVAGQAMGYLWVFVDAARGSAFVFDIMIDEAHRGKGAGTRALQLLEDEMRTLGVTTIGLNVFADNPHAERLYRKLGYRATNMNMSKALSADGGVGQEN